MLSIFRSSPTIPSYSEFNRASSRSRLEASVPVKYMNMICKCVSGRRKSYLLNKYDSGRRKSYLRMQVCFWSWKFLLNKYDSGRQKSYLHMQVCFWSIKFLLNKSVSGRRKSYLHMQVCFWSVKILLTYLLNKWDYGQRKSYLWKCLVDENRTYCMVNENCTYSMVDENITYCMVNENRTYCIGRRKSSCKHMSTMSTNLHSGQWKSYLLMQMSGRVKFYLIKQVGFWSMKILLTVANV